MGANWARASSGDYIDIHAELHPYSRVLSFFERLEQEFDVLKYCGGANAGGRRIFQIFSIEFIQQVAAHINRALVSSSDIRPVLEVMSGDGRLTEFLKPNVNRRMVATDARLGEYEIEYPKWVEKFDALDSVQRLNPSVVLLSWEPFFSTVGAEIVDTGTPTVWIGDRRNCAVHSDIFDRNFIKTENPYALGRKDSFATRQFETDVYLFNWTKQWQA
ncbi:MAG: hypothetical protein ACFFD9_02800 [Candidatus Thorarchaeota archaeon]